MVVNIRLNKIIETFWGSMNTLRRPYRFSPMSYFFDKDADFEKRILKLKFDSKYDFEKIILKLTFCVILFFQLLKMTSLKTTFLK